MFSGTVRPVDTREAKTVTLDKETSQDSDSYPLRFRGNTQVSGQYTDRTAALKYNNGDDALIKGLSVFDHDDSLLAVFADEGAAGFGGTFFTRPLSLIHTDRTTVEEADGHELRLEFKRTVETPPFPPVLHMNSWVFRAKSSRKLELSYGWSFSEDPLLEFHPARVAPADGVTYDLGDPTHPYGQGYFEYVRVKTGENRYSEPVLLDKLVIGEDLSGQLGGDRVFTCGSPYRENSLSVYLNGLKLTKGANSDFIEKPGLIDFELLFDPPASGGLTADYVKA